MVVCVEEWERVGMGRLLFANDVLYVCLVELVRIHIPLGCLFCVIIWIYMGCARINPRKVACRLMYATKYRRIEKEKG
jgi:hypothetical protein